MWKLTALLSLSSPCLSDSNSVDQQRIELQTSPCANGTGSRNENIELRIAEQLNPPLATSPEYSFQLPYLLIKCLGSDPDSFSHYGTLKVEQ
jgi:hypothetical protein